MFEALEISRQTYYQYRNTEDKDYYDYELIKEIFEESKNTYVCRRVCEGLMVKYSVTFNHKKVARIMQKYGLKPEYIKRIRPNYSQKRIQEDVKPNLVNRKFNTLRENQVWVTDILISFLTTKDCIYPQYWICMIEKLLRIRLQNSTTTN